MSRHVLTGPDTHLQQLIILSQTGAGQEDPGQQTENHRSVSASPLLSSPLHSYFILYQVWLPSTVYKRAWLPTIVCPALPHTAESALPEKEWAVARLDWQLRCRELAGDIFHLYKNNLNKSMIKCYSLMYIFLNIREMSPPVFIPASAGPATSDGQPGSKFSPQSKQQHHHTLILVIITRLNIPP